MELGLSDAGWHGVDLAVAAVLAYGFIRGAVRGLSGELARLLCVALIVAGARMAGPRISLWLAETTRLGSDPADLAGLLLALAAATAAVLLARLAVRSVLAFSFRPRIERIGGALAGLATAALAAAVGLVLASRSPWETVRRAASTGSMSGRTANALLPFYERLAVRVPLPRQPPEPPPASAPEADSVP